MSSGPPGRSRWRFPLFRSIPTTSGTASPLAPALIDHFAAGLPELYRDNIDAAPAHMAAPGCYPTTASLAYAPLLSAGLVEPTRIVVDAAVSGVSGCRTWPEGHQPVRRVDKNVVPAHGLLRTVTPGRWNWRWGTWPASRSRCCSHHLVPMTRGILATCYARPAVDELSTDQLSNTTATSTPTSRSSQCWRRAESQQADGGLRRGAHDGALRSNVRVPPCSRFNLRSRTTLAERRRPGQAVQGANIVLGFPEANGLGDGSCLGGRECHYGQRASGGGLRDRDQERRGAPDLALRSIQSTPPPVVAAGVFTSNIVVAAPCRAAGASSVAARVPR